MDQDKNEEEDSPFKSTIFLRKLCLFNSASVFDMQREFARAANKYYELFQLSCTISDEKSSTQQQNNSFLQSAMKCAILTDPSQPTRSRMLGTHKDERTVFEREEFQLFHTVILSTSQEYDARRSPIPQESH